MALKSISDLVDRENVVLSLFDLIDEVMKEDGVFEMSDEEFDDYCKNFDDRFNKGKLNK